MHINHNTMSHTILIKIGYITNIIYNIFHVFDTERIIRYGYGHVDTAVPCEEYNIVVSLLQR